MNSKLQQTEFSVEKIRNVVNVGRSSAYQVYTTPGEQIGFLGKLELPELHDCSNDDSFARISPRAMAGKPRRFGLLKSLTAIIS